MNLQNLLPSRIGGIRVLKIRILCLGSIKEKYMRQGIDEYLKRLRSYAQVSIIEIPDSPIPRKEKDCQIMLKNEAIKLRQNLRGYNVLLDIDGKELSSVEMAKQMEEWMISGNSTITFVIGSSLGVDSDLKKEFDFLWSFGLLTFPHQLMRLMLLEQIYRVFKIQSGEPYHK